MSMYPANPMQPSNHNFGFQQPTSYPIINQPTLPVNASYTPSTQQKSMAAMKPLAGRIIEPDVNVNEIPLSEVPMDGSVTFFPVSDYSCIYAKQWHPNGSVQTVRYVPEVLSTSEETDEQDVAGVSLQDIFNQLNNLEDLIKKNNRPHNNYNKNRKPYQNREKKENPDA